MPLGLTLKQRKFVEAYTGNGVAAAKAAGYEGNDDTLAVTASRLLGNAKVAKALKKREEGTLRPLIADREERLRFWSRMLRDKGASPGDRLKASELLGKANADFVDRVEHGGKVTLEALVEASLKKGGGE